MTQLDSKEQTIEGIVYCVRMLDPLTANDLLIDLGKVIGPSLGALAGSSGSIEKLMEAGLNFESAISLFVEKVDKAQMRSMIDMLSDKTMLKMPDGKEPELSGIFDSHFQGKIGLMYKWLRFALEAQFGDFSDAIARAIKSSAAAVATTGS